MDQSYMKKQPVLRLVLKMSLPMILSMLVNSLYNIIDSYFVSGINEKAMTALSLVFPVQNLIGAVCIGFGVGMNAVIAFFLGARKNDKANDAATQGVILSLAHGALLTVISIAIMPWFLSSFTADAETIDMGLQYSNIVFAFSAFIAVDLAFEKIFQSVGAMTVSMACMMTGCIANIILDPIFISGLGPIPAMGIRGAAIATGVGHVLTFAAYLLFYIFKPIPVKLHSGRFYWNWSMTGKLYSIGIPATLNLALPSLLVSALNAILASFSDAYVLVLGIYYKLQTFLYLTSNGIIQGIRPLIGYNYGAGETGRVKKIYSTTMVLTLGIMLVGTVLCLAAPDKLMGIFMESEENIAIGATALRIISAGFIVSSVSVVSSGALEGLGMGVPSLIISLCRYLVIIVPAAFILSRLIGAAGVWHAFWVTEFISAAISWLMFKKMTKEKQA